MMLDLILALAAAGAASTAVPASVPTTAPAPAQPAEVTVTGTTTADPAVVKDALAELRSFAGGHIVNCGDLTAVRATPQPVGWQPADPNFRIGPPGSRYERWDATMCGRTESFLLVFWNEKGPQFQVGHPFPADPAPAKPAPAPSAGERG